MLSLTRLQNLDIRFLMFKHVLLNHKCPDFAVLFHSLVSIMLGLLVIEYHRHECSMHYSQLFII